MITKDKTIKVKINGGFGQNKLINEINYYIQMERIKLNLLIEINSLSIDVRKI